jgi:hypothetical protein
MMNKENAQITVLTSKRPRVLTKKISLAADGKVIKEPSAQLYEGQARVVNIQSMQEFSDVLQDLKCNQALVYGTPKGELSTAEVVTKDVYESLKEKQGVITRSKDHFAWPTGKGIMMFDYDPDEAALCMEEVLDVLYKVCPEIKDTDHVWWTSSSSNIFNDETGERLSGVTGQRVYLMVEDATDIERAAKVIAQKLWLAGYGKVKISQSGTLLERVSFDMSVYQPSRLDFAAGASTNTPLSQKRGNPILKKGTKLALNTKTYLPDLNASDLKNVEVTKIAQKTHAESDASKVKKQFTAQLVMKVAKKFDDLDQDTIKEQVEKALESSVLPPYWPLYVLRGDSIVEVDVETVLAEKFTFHECLCLDPVDPDYDDRRLVGKLYLHQNPPCIHSFARGGHNYILNRYRHQISLPGRLNPATNQTIDILQESQEVFCYGTTLVQPINKKLVNVDRISLKYILSGIIQYKNKHGECDPSNDLTDSVYSVAKKLNINPITGFVDHPVIDSALRLFGTQGYDENMKLLGRFDADDFDYCDAKLSNKDILYHLERIQAPFTEFDLAGPDDKSVLLGAVFSAVLRQILPTCPVFGFDAPMQGSGKTLLAETIAIIASGMKAPALAPGRSDYDEEFRKRLLTLLLEGEKVCLFDNIVGEFDSASFAAAITSEVFQDRILKTSTSPKVLVKTLFLITGNNLRFTGDMTRRVLKARLEPKDDKLTQRTYSFDPTIVAKENRNAIISSVLSLINHWKQCGKPEAPGTMTSFNDWDVLVRQPLAFIARELPQTGLVDLLDVSSRQQADSGDKESLIALLHALVECFGEGKRFKAKDVFSAFNGNRPNSLEDAILVFERRENLQSSQHIGKLLRGFVLRYVDGMVLKAKGASGSLSYWVEFSDEKHRPEVAESGSHPPALRVNHASAFH